MQDIIDQYRWTASLIITTLSFLVGVILLFKHTPFALMGAVGWLMIFNAVMIMIANLEWSATDSPPIDKEFIHYLQKILMTSYAFSITSTYAVCTFWYWMS